MTDHATTAPAAGSAALAASADPAHQRTAHRLIQLGLLLFLLGLLTGFTLPLLANARLGLASHLQGILNGFFLILLGLVWSRVQVPRAAAAVAFWLALYGTYANWATNLLAGVWDAGGRFMPLAAPGSEGTAVQENLIAFGLFSLSFAMIIVTAITLYGLRPQSSR